MRRFAPLLAFLVCSAQAEAPRQSLDDAWWTGPMLAASAGTLPAGHMLVEPYLFDIHSKHADFYGNLTYINYGVTDRFTVGVIPTGGYADPDHGEASTSVRIGDVAVQGQFRLTQYDPESGFPTISVVLRETFPSGKYDHLGTHLSDGQGSGSYVTAPGLFIQDYAWLPNGRILRMRLDMFDSISSSANLSGTSVYGTGPNFHGKADTGNSFSADASWEYSLTREWVLALDVTYGVDASTRLLGTHTPGAPVTRGELPSSRPIAFAPAVEYSWTPYTGVLLGTRIIPAGRNVTASVTPAVALNMVF